MNDTDKVVNERNMASLRYDVGDVIRIPTGRGFRVWKIVGLCHGGLGTESNYQICPLDQKVGQEVGGKDRECLVPMLILDTHGEIQRL